jgi:biopolymer transport protein ExbD
MQAHGNSEGPLTAINITPLVDVVLVLLIIFMVTAPMIVHRTMKVDIPKSAHHSHTATKALEIVMDAQKQTYLSGKIVSRNELSELLARAVLARADTRVILAADRKVDYGEIVSLLDLIRGSGINKIGLEVKSL